MEGVFNANMRIVHLKLGEQLVELTQYISPPTGRPIPTPSYSNDESFEHIAIVVSDIDAAYKILQETMSADFRVSGHNPAIGSRGGPNQGDKFHDPEHHDLELLYFPPGKGEPVWQKPTTEFLLALAIPL